jgi:purine-binding chemotaxis protein CheW
VTRAILLPVGRDWYALPPVALQEVVAGPAVTEVPTAPPTVRCLFNVRGQIVPLLDTAALLGLEPTVTSPFAVVVQTAHGPAGLSVTGVPEPAELAWLVGPTRARGTVGAYAASERVAVMLDPQALVAQLHRPGGG